MQAIHFVEQSKRCASGAGDRGGFSQCFVSLEPYSRGRETNRGREASLALGGTNRRYSPHARLARATAGMTQIVASRHRRGMFAIDANQTSPIATVTSSTH